MASNKIKIYGEEVLRQPCKKVTKFTSKIRKLIDDLLKEMYAANGVGLAAPQIGVPLRVFVIDTSIGDEPLNPIVFVNPVIIKKEGAVPSYEGCLSFPDVYTTVRRYEKVTVKAYDHKNRPFTLTAKEGTLLCRAIQHENDHLEGILFIDHSVNRFDTNQALQDKGLPPVQEDYLLEEPELDEIIEKKLIEQKQQAEEMPESDKEDSLTETAT